MILLETTHTFYHKENKIYKKFPFQVQNLNFDKHYLENAKHTSGLIIQLLIIRDVIKCVDTI